MTDLTVEVVEPAGTVQVTATPGEAGVDITVEPTVVALATATQEAVEIAVEGPAGPPGPAGTGYTYTQAVPASTWIVTHNLGRAVEPTVLLDSRPTVPVWTDVAHGDLNHTTIVFPSPVTGKAYF